jgi:hypothetical protein
VSLLGRKRDATPSDAPDPDAAEPDDEAAAPVKTTAPKGRPTPKRDAARRRAPVSPAPMTNAEARRRRKEVAGRKLTKAERKESKDAQRQRIADRRQRMMAGDEAYLMPRDKGPVRRYVRDLVDSRGNLLGLFMPLALLLVVLSYAAQGWPQIAASSSVAMMALVVIMIIDAIFLGRRINKAVDVKFPQNTETGFKLGFYAASRATQLRRMRAPRPQVKRGDDVG